MSHTLGGRGGTNRNSELSSLGCPQEIPGDRPGSAVDLNSKTPVSSPRTMSVSEKTYTFWRARLSEDASFGGPFRVESHPPSGHPVGV